MEPKYPHQLGDKLPSFMEGWITKRKYPNCITFDGKRINVRVVHALTVRPFTEEGKDKSEAYVMLDSKGRYYFNQKVRELGPNGKFVQIVRRIHDKDVLRYIVNGDIDDEHLREQFLRAINDPAYSFVRHGKKREKRVGPFGVQLELATAIVEVIDRLDGNPNPQTLAAARRRVYQLSRDLDDIRSQKICSAA